MIFFPVMCTIPILFRCKDTSNPQFSLALVGLITNDTFLAQNDVMIESFVWLDSVHCSLYSLV